MRTVVIGAAGQLGSATEQAWRQAGHVVVGLRRSDLDITDPDGVRQRLLAERPELIINCAAYNQVDAAEDDPGLALAVNTWAVRSLAGVAAALDATFVHYSTDFVFDGVADQPYVEGDAPNPRSVYGMSKLLGEWMAAIAPKHYVLRVESLFGGDAGASSVDRMITALRGGQPVTAFADRTVSPSYVADVIAATTALAERGLPYGVYHCVNSGQTTWLELAMFLRQCLHLPNAEITPGRAASLALRAPRPLHAALSNDKLVRMGVPMPTWVEAVSRHLATSLD